VVGEINRFGQLDMDSVPTFEQAGYGAYRLRSTKGACTCLGFGEVSNLDEKNTISIPTSVCDCEATAAPGASLMGWVSRPAWVASRRICSVCNALCNRHGKKQPDCPGFFRHFLRVLDVIRDEVNSDYHKNQEYYWSDWIKKWPLLKQCAILHSEVHDNLKCNRVKAFVKKEFQSLRPKKPRVIQMYFNLASQGQTARHITSLQKAFASTLRNKHMGGGIYLTFASGMKHDELGEWMSFAQSLGCTFFYERDGKNWDSCMNRKHMDLKMYAYSVLPPDVLTSIEDGFKVRGVSATKMGLVRYLLTGTTKSGHNDTTLGNSIVNAAIVYEVMVELGLRGSIIVAGDDCLVALDSDFDADLFAVREREFGIVPEYRKFDDPLDVSFISGVWYPNDLGWSFGPKIGRLFSRLFWTCSPPGRRFNANWMYGVITGTLASFEGSPIVETFLKKQMPPVSKGIKIKDKYFDDNMPIRCNWYYYYLVRYGITNSEINSLESYLGTLPRQPLLLYHPIIEKLIAVDMAEVYARPVVGTNYPGHEA